MKNRKLSGSTLRIAFFFFIIVYPFHLLLYISIQWTIARTSMKSIYILFVVYRISLSLVWSSKFNLKPVTSTEKLSLGWSECFSFGKKLNVGELSNVIIVACNFRLNPDFFSLAHRFRKVFTARTWWKKEKRSNFHIPIPQLNIFWVNFLIWFFQHFHKVVHEKVFKILKCF